MGVKSFGLCILLAALGAACGSGTSTPAQISTGGTTGSGGTGGGGGVGTGGGGSGGTGGGGGGPLAPLQFSVSPGEDRHKVSPLIYGVNDPGSAGKMHATLIRLGGNDVQAYNWEVNSTNGGRLEGYENRAASGGDSSGGAAKLVLDQAAKNGATAIISLPIGDYVAADRKPGDVRATGTDYLTQRFDANKAMKGAPLYLTPDPADGVVYQDEFANWTKHVAGSTPVMFALDNQPALWFEDHAEIHPQQTTYDELVTRDISYAKAIRAVWPGVPILGYVGYGWQSFQDLQHSPDGNTKGEFLGYYLDQMQTAQSVNGQRLIDYLDVHWWSEALGANVRVTAADAGPDVVAARLQAPRELWDPDFREDSWIQDDIGYDSIRLIPRLEDAILAHYPGTKLSISAWYYGGGGDISGAIATADALGIFGREGVDAAAIDLSGGDDSFTLAAFSAYLDYDGKGGHFGDRSIRAATNDRVGSSVYASIKSSDPKHLVIIALNKRSAERTTTLTINSKTTYKSCAVYTLKSSSTKLVVATPLSSTGDNSFSYDMPALSVSVIVPRQ